MTWCHSNTMQCHNNRMQRHSNMRQRRSNTTHTVIANDVMPQQHHAMPFTTQCHTNMRMCRNSMTQCYGKMMQCPSNTMQCRNNTMQCLSNKLSACLKSKKYECINRKRTKTLQKDRFLINPPCTVHTLWAELQTPPQASKGQQIKHPMWPEGLCSTLQLANATCHACTAAWREYIRTNTSTSTKP